MSTNDEGGSRKARNPFAGLLSGLGEIVEKFGELADKGEEVSRVGSFDLGQREPGKPLRGVYGLSFKVGIGGQGLRIEPFGNIRRDEDSGESVVEDVREPLVDVFDEDSHVMILAEMPGVEANDVDVDLTGQVMTLTGSHGDRKYRKEIELPHASDPASLKISCKNGIVEITCEKVGTRE